MKHSLIVAMIAAATALTACGTKHEAAKVGGGVKAQKTILNNEPTYTDLMYQELENGPWLGECGDNSVFSIFNGNTKRTVVSFENARMKVSTISYDLADCKGEATEELAVDVSYRLIPSYSMYSDVPAFIISQVVYKDTSVHDETPAEVVGKYNVAVDGNKMILNAALKNKKMSESSLVLTRQAPVHIPAGSERF